MVSRPKTENTHICPKTGRPLNTKKYRWVRWVVPFAGLFSLIWFLLRVVPKPSRATYPCQRMAAPLASGFVVWLLGVVGSSLAYRKARRLLGQSRYLAAVICAGVAVAAVWVSLSATSGNPAGAAAVPAEPPNSPIGVAKGIYPGRVVWIRDSAATSWDGSTGNWWDDDNTAQDVVDDMVSKAIRTVAGTRTDVEAWDGLFRHFNQTHGFGDVGYQDGEKIAVKINMNQDAGAAWGPAIGTPSPHVVYSFLDQLINVAGIPGSAITIYDASRYIGDPIYNKVRNDPDPDFQSVTFVVSPVVARAGRVAATHDPDHPIYTMAGVAYLPRCVTQAKYLINMALLRPHQLYGITLCAKNHFGSVRFPSTSTYQGWTPSPLHNYGLRSNPMSSYNCLVELNGHRHLAGKTLLYFIDGLYPASHQGGNVIRYLSFENDWFSGILASQDPVAIDSVGFDFLRNEPRCTEVIGHPENYLHEMALANNPPSGISYDPEGDGIPLTSLGVHEHWNNAAERKYSRNLGTGTGIELVAPSRASVDLNSDGIVDIEDLLRLIASWDQDDPEVDIAPPFGDGTIDALDLEVLTNHWGQEIEDPALIAHWKLDETEGIDVFDSAGSHHGIVVGAPAWQPDAGQMGGALEFDGATCVTTDSILNPNAGPFSVLAWVKGGGPGQVIMSQAGGANWLLADPATSALMTDLKELTTRRPTALCSSTVVADGDWHRVGLVWDGVKRSLHVDGVEVATDTQGDLPDSDSGLYLGCGQEATPDTFFVGLIDDVRIYNRAVSP